MRLSRLFRQQGRQKPWVKAGPSQATDFSQARHLTKNLRGVFISPPSLPSFRGHRHRLVRPPLGKASQPARAGENGSAEALTALALRKDPGAHRIIEKPRKPSSGLISLAAWDPRMKLDYVKIWAAPPGFVRGRGEIMFSRSAEVGGWVIGEGKV